MAEPLRVLQVIDDSTVGGGQNHLLLLAHGLKARGFHVSVACAGSGYLVTELQKYSIVIHPVNLSNIISPKQFFQLKELCKKGHYAVLHTHGGTAGLWGRLAGVWAGIPVRIHTHHGLHVLHWERSLKAAAARASERFLKHFTSAVICVSEGEAQLGIRHRVVDRRNCVVIRNGIRLQDYDSLTDPVSVRKEFGLLPTHIVIGMVGRFHLQKGHTYLLKAIPQIVRHYPEARFLLVGEGELLESVCSGAEELGVKDKVIFAGARYDIPAILGSIDIFVLPSLWEGLPLSLLEASAAGNAIVATNVEGTNEIIRHDVNGLLVPPRDSGALGAAISRLIADESLRRRLASSAHSIAHSSYSNETMVDSVADLYRKSYEAHKSA